VKFRCAHCGRTADKPAGAVNRSRSAGLRLFCDRRCSGIGRRKPPKSKAQKVEEKRLYDMEYRHLNREMLRAKKRARHLATYDPEKERVKRKARMPRHVEYCRRPEYKRWKSQYDRQYRAREYGAFAEAFVLLLDVNREIRTRRASKYDKYEQNQTQNKALARRRDESQVCRDSSSRRDHPATYR
jgi:hypothetical protein